MNFREWIDKHYLLKQKTQKEAAADLQLTECQLSEYVNFKRFPLADTALRLEKICTGLVVEKWLRDYMKVQAEFNTERWLKEYQEAAQLKIEGRA